MEDLKNKVEAVLFTIGRGIGLNELSQLCGVGSIGVLKDILRQLQDDYNKRNTSLQIVNENDKWYLNIKRDYLYLTEKLLTDSELDRPTQETLAVIAYKQPILQSEIIKIRGNSAYEHIHILKETNFITSDKSGRTRILKLAPKFYDYFDVVDDTLKSKLESVSNEKQPEN